MASDRSVWRQPRIWSLAFGQTLAWAGLLYLFPALLVRWENDLGWSRTVLGFALTGALLIAGLIGIVAGRLIDRGYGRVLMTVTALGGAGLIALLPFIAHLWQFYLIWLLVGVMMAGCLYEPCFAVITRQFGTAATQPIILVTLVAGFAGTLSFPLANAVASAFGWYWSVWLFAILVGAVAAPLFWFGVGPPGLRANETKSPARGQWTSAISLALSQPLFWLLALAFGALALNHSMIISHALPLIESRGMTSATAILAASLFGVAQVIGRLCLLAAGRRVSLVHVCAIGFVALCLSSISLALAGLAFALLFIFVLLQGSAVGIQTVAKPVVTAEVLGRRDFGTISALVSVVYVTGWAFGPSLSGLVWQMGGYDSVLKVTFCLALAGLLCIVIALRLSRRAKTVPIDSSR